MPTCFTCPLQCAINPDGECVGSSEYETYVNSQAYYIPNYKYYPSSAYSYCASDDATCSRCVAEWSGKSSASVSTSDVCTGQDGCICLAACEVMDRIATILTDENCSGGSSSDSDSSLSSTERILVAIAVGASVGFFFYAMIWVLRRYIVVMRRREQGELCCQVSSSGVCCLMGLICWFYVLQPKEAPAASRAQARSST